ncbi:MAG: hypothetical protein SO160_04245 [Lachnospiraceae bacterium]|nr:hypothetical protein [Lachnospiraceae bacterium]
MNIEEKFNIIAKEYDVNRKNFIPCFDDFYGNTTKMITSNIDVPKRVLDLDIETPEIPIEAFLFSVIPF